MTIINLLNATIFAVGVYRTRKRCDILTPGINITLAEFGNLRFGIDVEQLPHLAIRPLVNCSNHLTVPYFAVDERLLRFALTEIDLILSEEAVILVADVYRAVHIADSVNQQREMRYSHRILHRAVVSLQIECVQTLADNVALVVKEKSVNELADADVYTYVTLKSVEFMNKQGAYTNVFEMMPLRTFMNQDRNPWGYADGWASLLKDAEGESIYMLVNSKCSWRRNGTGVPKGVGQISGILVHEYLRRYGDNLGKYSIRPLNEQDVVKQMPKEESSSYVVVADWNYDRNYRGLLDVEGIGKVSGNRATRYSGRILPDEGVGFLSNTAGATVRFDTDYDTRYANDNSGMRKFGGLRFESNVHNWLSNGSGIVVEVSTEGVTGKALTFDFSFGVGNHDIQNCWGFPAYWKVEYSTDGKNFKVAKDNIVLRALPYTYGRLKGLDNADRMPNCDTAMGFTDHSVKLPASLLGQKSVTIRLIPASRRMASIPTNELEDSIQGEITSEINKPLVLRMGRISVKAVK